MSNVNGGADLDVGREEGEAIEYVQNLRGFHLNWICFVIAIPCLYFLNIYTTPEDMWVIYPALAWLVAIAMHGAVMLTLHGFLGVLGPRWQKRQIEKRLGGEQ